MYSPSDLRKDFTLVAANPAYIATVVDDPAKFPEDKHEKAAGNI